MTAISAAQTSAPANTAALSRSSTASAQTDSPTIAPPSKPASAANASAAMVSLSGTATAALATGSTAAKDPPAGKKDFATVANDARSSLDAGYEKLGKTGDIYTTEAEWKTVMGSLDRRSLYAIASNQGGQFSEAEKGAAEYTMNKQIEAAMGMDTAAGVADIVGNSKYADAFKAEIKFLDGVSDEEKSSLKWAKQRAVAQDSYEVQSRRQGQEPENFDIDNPVVKLIKGGIDRLRQLGNPANQLEDMPQYKQAVQLAEQLKAANSQNNSDSANTSAAASPKVDLTV